MEQNKRKDTKKFSEMEIRYEPKTTLLEMTKDLKESQCSEITRIIVYPDVGTIVEFNLDVKK